MFGTSSRRSRAQKPGPQLLLNAHYDSTPTGPGAGDDGLGVAVLLEVGSILEASTTAPSVDAAVQRGRGVRAQRCSCLRSCRPAGTSGQFADQYRYARGEGPCADVRDQRTQRRRAEYLQRGNHRPYANSISTDFAKLIPNTTDVVFFGRPDGHCSTTRSSATRTRYHSPGDTIAALNPDSVGHVGSEVLAATRAMARRDPGHARVWTNGFHGHRGPHFPAPAARRSPRCCSGCC